MCNLPFRFSWSLGLAIFFVCGHASVCAVTMTELLADPHPREIIFKTVGTNALKLSLFPAEGGSATERRPAVVWIRGGGWTRDTPDNFIPQARYFASRGAVSVSVFYRLERPEGPSIRDCLVDCKSAIRYLRAHAAELGLDPERIAVAGESAGGHLAACLATIDDFNDPDDDLTISAVPNLLLLFNPVLDLAEDNWIRFAVGGKALADPNVPRPSAPADVAMARAISPIYHVKAGLPPMLLMHGTGDRVVRFAQAERFAAAVKEAGNVCEFVSLKDVDHSFIVALWTAPEPLVVASILAADRFLAKHGYLSGEPTLTVSAKPAWVPRK